MTNETKHRVEAAIEEHTKEHLFDNRAGTEILRRRKLEKSLLAAIAERGRLREANAKLESDIDKLRGHLQNCVNSLECARRRSPSLESSLNPAIEAANKALYETIAKHKGKPK